jgi:aryl-alcohol dehydrogenase-like predicted oxidoreductase
MSNWREQPTTLGSTSIKVPRICLGTMTWGEQNTEQQALEQLDYSLANGLNFIDTAEMYPIPVKAETYSTTETYIGRWLAKQKRESIVLATKVAGPGRGMAWVRTPERLTDGELSKQDIILACEASLKRLQTDYIDLYQIHWPARYTPLFGAGVYEIKNERDCVSIQQQIEAMEVLIKAGKIRAYGLSNESAWGVAEFSNIAKRLGVTRPATIQNNYSLLAREFETGLVEACRHEKVSLLSYSPLAFGHLTGKYLEGQQPAGARMTLFGASWPRYNRPEVMLAVQDYDALAKQSGMTVTQLAMGFQMRREFVGSCIFGATSMAQLKETVVAADTIISDELMGEVDKIHRRYMNPIQ